MPENCYVFSCNCRKVCKTSDVGDHFELRDRSLHNACTGMDLHMPLSTDWGGRSVSSFEEYPSLVIGGDDPQPKGKSRNVQKKHTKQQVTFDRLVNGVVRLPQAGPKVASSSCC